MRMLATAQLLDGLAAGYAHCHNSSTKMRIRTVHSCVSSLILLLSGILTVLQILGISSILPLESSTARTDIQQSPRIHHHPEIVIDALVIGSNSRWEYIDTQQHLWKEAAVTLPSLRYFWNVTEQNDVNPHCASEIPVQEIQSFCRKASSTNSFPSMWKDFFAPASILQQKLNPAGWLCAQSRPATGLWKLFQYEYHFKSSHSLPDYLLIQDDDTFWDMQRLLQLLQTRSSVEPPMALAACRFYLPGMWMPHGGFGIILNRRLLGLLRHALWGVHAPTRAFSLPGVLGNESLRNETLKTEAPYLLYKYATISAWSRPHSQWSSAFCAHSDWLWGHVIDSLTNAAVQSLVTEGDFCEQQRRGRHGRNSKCNVSSLVCHGVTPKEMILLSKARSF